MTPVPLDRMARLAEAATPGPWGCQDGDVFAATASGEWKHDLFCDEFYDYADAEFIAAADPQTVLALIEAVRAALVASDTGEADDFAWLDQKLAPFVVGKEGE